MRRALLTTLLVTALSILSYLAQAQNVKEIMEQDLGSAAGIYYPYQYEETDFTPAPRGFKPVYISHYGRHGSRYHTKKGYFQSALDVMSAQEELLTPEGKEVLDAMAALLEAHNGMEGHLSPRGAREHRALARRMYGNFKRVFRKRTEVRCLSSIYPRCLVSMANFTSELKGLRPKLNLSFETGEKNMKYILPAIKCSEAWKFGDYLSDSLRAAYDYRPLYEKFFTDPDKAMHDGLEAADFARFVFAAGAIIDDLDMDNVIFRHFPKDCLEDQLRIKTITFYSQYCNSAEFGEHNRAHGVDIMRYVVEKADEALQKGSRVAADLRFGHDTGVVPLAVSMGLEGFCEKLPVRKCYESTSVSVMTPMATNIQIVFYRNRKEEILVKVLFNEKETRIPALEAYSGPYYRWEDLRAYMLSEIDNFLLFNSAHESVPEPANT